MSFNKSASELCCLNVSYERDAYISSACTLGSVYEVEGVDPSGISPFDAHVVKSVMSSLLKSASDLTMSQYYVHRKSKPITIKSREHPISNAVSKKREDYLNNRDIYESKIYFMPELPFGNCLNNFSNYEFLTNLFLSPFSKTSRSYVKTRVSEKESVLAYEEDLKKTYHRLKDIISAQRSKIDLIGSESRLLELNDSWPLLKSIFNFNFDYLDNVGSLRETYLSDRVFSGDVKIIKYNGVDYIKFSSSKNIYVRIASIKGFHDEYLNPSGFCAGNKKPVNIKGEYIIMSRFRGLSRSQKMRYFKALKDEVERSNIDPFDMFGGDKKSFLEKQLTMDEHDKSVLEEVRNAQLSNDSYGQFESAIAVFGDTPDEVERVCKEVSISFDEAGFDIVWESAGMDCALESFYPFSQFISKRKHVLNSVKAGALSLFYKSSEGLKEWEYSTSEGVVKEEAFFVFESEDGAPFYYTPYIGGRAMTIGVGPIRSGKTFTKNTLATHIAKYSGHYTAIDIDPGTEAIAKFFGEDGGIFRLDEGEKKGFNPFHVAKGPDDVAFKAHFIRQLEGMAASNSNIELKTFTRSEQKRIDDSILSVLSLPYEMRSFKAFLDHCNDDIRLKLSRFHGSGMYSSLYDNKIDGIGSLDKLVSVYNIMGVKGDSVALPLVMSEIVYRVLRTFENPKIRDVLKVLDIDEAHAFLKIPGMVNVVTNGVRTWGKWNAGLSLWTQSPKELGKIEDWPALRSAASTLWFMADAEMNRDIYKEVFELTEGELDAIENLEPKKQAFIIQRDLNVAKVVNINVGAEQKVINTSDAGQSMQFLKNIELLGDVNKAIDKTAKELGFND